MASRSPAALVARGPLLLGLLVALAALLRLLNLADNPGWDGDEGYNWSIAANLAAGHVQRFALQYTFVDHPPLFYLLGAALMRIWTHDLIALRTLSALCGVATVPAIYALAGKLGSRRDGILAACIYAVWPQAVLQSRWCYTYNLLALLLVLALWAVLPRPAARTGIAANGATGLPADSSHRRYGGVERLVRRTPTQAGMAPADAPGRRSGPACWRAWPWPPIRRGARWRSPSASPCGGAGGCAWPCRVRSPRPPRPRSTSAGCWRAGARHSSSISGTPRGGSGAAASSPRSATCSHARCTCCSSIR